MNKSGTSELCARLRELAAQHPRYGYRRSDALGTKLPAWAVGLAKSPPDNSFDSFTRPDNAFDSIAETELAGTEPELQRHPPQTKVVVSRLSPSLKQHFRLSELQR